jgi:hypothetical protein
MRARRRGEVVLGEQRENHEKTIRRVLPKDEQKYRKRLTNPIYHFVADFAEVGG